MRMHDRREADDGSSPNATHDGRQLVAEETYQPPQIMNATRYSGDAGSSHLDAHVNDYANLNGTLPLQYAGPQMTADYSHLPALTNLTNYQTPVNPDYNGHVIHSAQPYNLVPAYFPAAGIPNASNQAHTTRTSPIQYSNFPPLRADRAASASPAYPDTTLLWPKVGDAPESNVRGANTIALQTQPFERDEFGPSSGATEHASEALHGSSSAGMVNWVAICQSSTPVDNIIRLGNYRPVSNQGVKSTGQYQDPYAYKNGPSSLFPIAYSSGNRYAKVEQAWYSRLSGQNRWPDVEKRWYDVLKAGGGDLFNNGKPTCAAPLHGRSVRVSAACRARMMETLYPAVGNPYDPAVACVIGSKSWEEAEARFPSCSDFDEALDKYFDSFLREAPFLHTPVFSISTCPPLLLFVMSCIGFGLLKKDGGCRFVQSNFNCVRDRIHSELEKKLTSTTKEAMSIFATTFLFLKLAALIDDHDHLSPCQLLYTSLVTLAQMHGMFSQYSKRMDVDMFSSIDSLQERWVAWGRVESIKRIAVSLMRLDSAYASFLGTGPVMRVAVIDVLLPCDERLFQAASAEDWQALQTTGHLSISMPSINSKASLGQLAGHTHLDYYSLHAVLNYLQLRNREAVQRLLDQEYAYPSDNHILVPAEYYLKEPTMRDLPLHVVAFADFNESLLPRFPYAWQKTNCLVFWHFLCMSLTANLDLFEIAAGRQGSRAAAEASESIREWSNKPVARRALLHAAAIYNLLSPRSQPEMGSLYVAFGTFAAALVMTLYTFAEPVQNNAAKPYDLTNEVEWKGFGLLGIDASIVPTPFTAGSTAEDFVRHGGPCVFNGYPLQGPSTARHVLDLYADLLSLCGRYNYTRMARILEMFSEMIVSSKGN